MLFWPFYAQRDRRCLRRSVEAYRICAQLETEQAKLNCFSDRMYYSAYRISHIFMHFEEYSPRPFCERAALVVKNVFLISSLGGLSTVFD